MLGAFIRWSNSPCTVSGIDSAGVAGGRLCVTLWPRGCPPPARSGHVAPSRTGHTWVHLSPRSSSKFPDERPDHDSVNVQDVLG